MSGSATCVKLPYGAPSNAHFASFWSKAMGDKGSPLRDATLVVGAAKQEISCNRGLITSHSGFLARYFEDEKHLETDKGHSTIPLPDLDGPAVEAIVAALASQTFACSLEQLEEVCRAADYLDVALIKAAFGDAVQEWGRGKAAEGADKHAAFLLWLAQLGDRYQVHALVDYACKTGLTAPDTLILPRLKDWPPAALLPHLMEKHLGLIGEAAKTAAQLSTSKAELRYVGAELDRERKQRSAIGKKADSFVYQHQLCSIGPPGTALYLPRSLAQCNCE